MKKENRKSAKEYLEEGIRDKPSYEQAWLKANLKPPIIISQERTERGVSMDEKYAKKLYGKGYRTHIHTHPVHEGFRIAATPSANDLYQFFLRDEKTAIIAQTDINGNIEGYTIIRKPKEFKNSNKLIEFMKDYNEYTSRLMEIPINQPTPSHLKEKPDGYELVESLMENAAEEPQQDITKKTNIFQDIEFYCNKRDQFSENGRLISDGKDVLATLKKFCDKYRIKYRFISMPEYKFDEKDAMFKKKKHSVLEGKVEIIALGLLGATLILQLPKITGFTISQGIFSNISNFLTIPLILISLILLLYSKIRIKKQ